MGGNRLLTVVLMVSFAQETMAFCPNETDRLIQCMNKNPLAIKKIAEKVGI